MIDIDALEALAKAALNGTNGLRPAWEAYSAAATPVAIIDLIGEVRALREDAELLHLLVATCDALDANSFDDSNQPGTLRITVKHKTQIYPELQMKIIDFLRGYKERVDATRGAA